MKNYFRLLIILLSFSLSVNADWFKFDQLLISLKLKKPYEDADEHYQAMVKETLQCMNYQGEAIEVKRFARPEDGYNYGCGATTGKIIFLLTDDVDPDKVCLQNFYTKFGENSIISTGVNRYVIYHEAAHVVLDHIKKRRISSLKCYLKNLFVGAIVCGLTYKGLSKIAPTSVTFVTENLLASFFILNSLTLLSVLAAYKQVLPLCRQQEMEADELAMRSLCNNGYKQIVKSQIDNVEKKARSICEDFLAKNDIKPDDSVIWAHGLVFQIDPQNKSIGSIIDYIDDNDTHPSWGRRYFLWKEILDEYEKSNDA